MRRRKEEPEGEGVELSVVVPCLDEAETVGALLDSLVGQSWGGSWELVLADNGSTDGSVEIVQGYRDRVPCLEIVVASARRGGAFARNRGAEAARGRSLVFVDADDEVAPGWLAAIGDALRRHRFVASRFEYEKLNAPGQAGVRGEVQSGGLQRLWYPPRLPHAGGCGLGIRRSLFFEVGGFDEDLPVLEDTDLCIRVQGHGVPLRFVEDARVHVRLREAPRDAFRQARRWARYNTLLHRRYRKEEVVRPGAWRRYLRGWRHVVDHLINPAWLREEPRRMRLAWSAGWHLGLLEGALRYGVPPVVKERSREARPSRRGAGVTGGGRA